MAAGYKFDIELTVRGHELRVTGLAYPPIAAVTSGPADRWAPAEGGEVEDIEAWYQRTVLRPRIRGGRQSLRGRRMRRHQWPRTQSRKLTDAMVESLDLAEKIQEELADRAGDYDE